MGFFRKLFYGDKMESKPSTPIKELNNPTIKVSSINYKPSTKIEPEILIKYRNTYIGQSLTKLNDLYFEIMEKIIAAKKAGNIEDLLMYCQTSLGLLEPLIKYNYQEYGDCRIKTIPALENSLIYFAINGNTGQLQNIKEIVDYYKELHPYKDEVKLAFARRELAANIFQYVKQNPNCKQTDLKRGINFEDANFISQTVYYMDKVGSLKKSKHKSRIYLNINLK